MPKEVNLMINQKGELNFSNPEPYITINVLTKETYEKLVELVERDTPAEVEVETTVNTNGVSYETKCPICKNVVVLANTEDTARNLVTKHCSRCGQVLIGGV